MAIDWGSGYHATWRVYEVNESTWADGAILANVSDMSIKRESDGDAPLIESGSVTIDLPIGDGFRERYLRIVMIAEQDGGSERVDVSTMRFMSASDVSDKGFAATELTGMSVLYPASVKKLMVGEYAPSGADGAAYAANMLSDVLRAPVVQDGSFIISDHVVFDVGSSVLEAVWLLLNAGNFVLSIDGDGTVHVKPMPTEPSLILDSAKTRLLMPSIGRDLDLSGVPNKYTAIDGDQMAEAVNDDPLSDTSTVTRGYTHDGDCPDTNPTRVDGETLAAYCARRLEEESTVEDSRSYDREWWPGVYPFSVVRGTVASVGIEGDYRVTRQSLKCGTGLVVSEEATREVKTWQRS